MLAEIGTVDAINAAAQLKAALKNAILLFLWMNLLGNALSLTSSPLGHLVTGYRSRVNRANAEHEAALMEVRQVPPAGRDKYIEALGRTQDKQIEEASNAAKDWAQRINSVGAGLRTFAAAAAILWIYVGA